jgi:hypothetical protein
MNLVINAHVEVEQLSVSFLKGRTNRIEISAVLHPLGNYYSGPTKIHLSVPFHIDHLRSLVEYCEKEIGIYLLPKEEKEAR